MTRSTWTVYTGRASWPQQQAGHAFAASMTGFSSREEAEAYAERCRGFRPNEPAVVVEIKPTDLEPETA